MAAHRYWRVRGMATHVEGATLRLAELALVDNSGTSVSAGVTPTSSVAPILGTLSSLENGNLTDSVTWNTALGLVLSWDFGGAPASLTTLKFAAPAQESSLLSVELDWSDDAVTWTTLATYFPIPWAGVGVFSPNSIPGKYWSTARKVTEVTVVSSDKKTLLSVSQQANAVGGTYMNKGVRQFEILLNPPDASGSNGVQDYGLGCGISAIPDTTMTLGAVAGTYGVFEDGSGTAYANGVSKPGTYPAFAKGDVFGVVADFDVGSITFYKNGVSFVVFSAPELVGGALALAPRITDRAGWANRVTNAVLEPESFAYPVVGALPWVGDLGLTLRDPAVGRLYPVGVAVSFLPGAERPLFSASKSIQVPKVGDYLDPDLSNVKTDTTGAKLLAGVGKIAGTVKVKQGAINKPIRRRVRLVRESDGVVVRETWSDAVTGAYSFEGLNTSYQYTVVSYDYTKDFRAVIADAIRAEVEVTP